jgi:hypothetical protein
MTPEYALNGHIRAPTAAWSGGGLTQTLSNLGGGPEFLRGILRGLPAVLRVLQDALLETLASNV